MLDQIRDIVKNAVKDSYGLDIAVEVGRPEEQFGDYYTNVALKLAVSLKRSPKEVAEELALKLKDNDLFDSVVVAGVGFINFSLSSQSLVALARAEPLKSLLNKVVVAEYSDPNPFKVLHAGHLYTSIVGDAVANLLENAGAKVHRVNFGGDIGLHVAKTIWAIIKDLGGELPDKLQSVAASDRSEWLSRCYVGGNEAFESGNDNLKNEIKTLNKKLYDISLSHDHSSPLANIYWTCRQWSYDYFESFYLRLDIKFEKYYPESEVAELGVHTVREHIPNVYQESQGAIIFAGEKYGLYSNVFINSQGVPTYAAKDVGLIMKKWQDYHFDKSVIITANEQSDYMKGVLTSVSLFAPELTSATTHLTHGVVKLAGGQKMSSRQGNILRATDILDLAEKTTKAKAISSDPRITVGAVKYAFLKQRLGGDIIYDPAESVSIEGNSGPYLQYAYARAMSILKKATAGQVDLKTVPDLTDHERSLLRKIGAYGETVELAVTELEPHHITNYLYDLAQTFNRFYEHSRVVNDERQDLRLGLIKLYVFKLAAGLKLLGIEPIEQM